MSQFISSLMLCFIFFHHLTVRPEMPGAALTPMTLIGAQRLSCDSSVLTSHVPLQRERLPSWLVPISAGSAAPYLVLSPGSVPSLPACGIVQTSQSDLHLEPGAPHPPATAKPASHGTCWFSLLLAAAPYGPAWYEVSSPRLCIHVTIKPLSV